MKSNQSFKMSEWVGLVMVLLILAIGIWLYFDSRISALDHGPANLTK